MCFRGMDKKHTLIDSRVVLQILYTGQLFKKKAKATLSLMGDVLSCVGTLVDKNKLYAFTLSSAPTVW